MFNILNFKKDKLPRHIAIIMDGNGRWAKKRGLSRTFGHQKGVKTLDLITRTCSDLGIAFLSVFAFSTENWQRDPKEVDFLMNLLNKKIEKEISKAKNQKTYGKLKFIGNRIGLSENLLASMNKAEAITKDNLGMQLNIMLNYGGRAEIISAINLALAKGVQSVKEADFANYLYTKDIPDPDLLIRTSGEQRVSNFLLWQSAYTEFYFTKKLWPDFNKKDLFKAIVCYQNRKRRFGRES